ncbi:AEC family transporter [Synechococcus sp. A10-1-5-1]|uniref:AEC family transporter n=1 Tax=Synechococcus sp. A10-1-5-1 TaxID=2936507 RepID=UPI002000DDF4|nr:AEC family transporter [Synechococcus sp. A10-1-5-1]UPM50971.1 AEC family transporter [Synechococcus sp. A10-1-5-1]
MLRLLLELAPCLLAGFWLGRRFPALPSQLAPPLLRWGMPLSLTGLLLKSGLPLSAIPMAGLIAAVTASGLFLCRQIPALLPARSLQLGAVVGNTGYFGLPVAIALLPSEALGFSVIYDLIGSLITWSAGPLLLSPGQSRASALSLFKTPVVQALLIALPLGMSPWGSLLGQWLWLPARVVLWLLLLLVGMRLGLVLQRIDQAEKRSSPSLTAALAIKLLVLPGVMWLVSVLLQLPALMQQALVLQAAAPTAMSVLLLAEAADAQNKGGEETIPAARLVLWSSGAAVLSLPLWFQLTAAM